MVGLVVFNAAGHYSRGVAALEDGSYGQAAAEFSAARLLVFPYRDAQLREEQAQRALTVQTADAVRAQARVDRVSGALDEAASALGARDSAGVLAALRALGAKDLRTVLKDDADVRRAAAALGEDLTAAAGMALRNQKWSRAGQYAAALLVLDPSAPEATALADRGHDRPEAQRAPRRGQGRRAPRPLARGAAPGAGGHRGAEGLSRRRGAGRRRAPGARAEAAAHGAGHHLHAGHRDAGHQRRNLVGIDVAAATTVTSSVG